MADGTVAWTKARAVASVATAKTEERWVEKAKAGGRRDLEWEVREHRARTAAARKSPGQMALDAGGGGG